METNTPPVITKQPLTYSNLKDAYPAMHGATPFNQTATSFANAKNNGNKNRRAKFYRAKDGKNLSGGGRSDRE